MNPHSGIGNKDKINDDNNTRTKAIASLSMAGIIVAAALLSGMLSLISSYPQPALAQQQNMTGTNAATTASNATGGGGAQSACTPSQTGGGQNATTNATTTTGGGSAATTGGNATMGTNDTSTDTAGGGGGNQSDVRGYIEQACMAAQNGDMQGVMMQLNLALNALEAKLTTTAEVANNATNAAGSEFNEEEGGRAEEVQQREEGGDQSPGQSMTQEEQ
jgi:hypothetical protein